MLRVVIILGLAIHGSVQAQVGPYSAPGLALLPAAPGVNGAMLQGNGGSLQLHTTVGDVSGFISDAVSPPVQLRPGYAGQLYNLQQLSLDPSPFTIAETSSASLSPVNALLEDGTWLNLMPSHVAWNIGTGPLVGIDAGGTVDTGTVYEDTTATVHARFLNRSESLALTVTDVDPDNFGSYAGDGLSDHWQVTFFGLDNPEAGPGRDPDLDDQANDFEELVGTDPTDQDSRFRLSIRQRQVNPQWMDIIFSPRFEDRDYAVWFTPNLEAAFQALDGGLLQDLGLERTVTDTNAVSPSRFYKVQITRP